MHDEKKEKVRFLESEEGRIFTAGSLMLIAWTVGLVVLSRLWPEKWLDLVRIVPTHAIGGRAASVAYGLSCGFGKTATAALVVYLDVMIMLLVYPILIFLYKYHFEGKLYRIHLKPMIDSAQKSATRFRKFKIVSVFFFVWAPISLTGIIMGSVLGFLLGLSARSNLLTVTLGTTAAVICWTLALNSVFSGISPGIQTAIAFTIVAGVVAWRVVRSRNGRRSSRKD